MLPEAKEASQSYEQKPAEPVNGVAHLRDDRTIEGATHAERIRRLRENNELTLKEFGARVGVSHVAVSHWEAGKNNPSVKRLRQIAQTFAVPIDWLSGGDVEIGVRR